MDRNDIKFVLTAPPAGSPGGFWWYAPLGYHALWVLDFNLVRDMAMDEEGVRQAVKAFCKNDLYYPRPGNSKLWTASREQYLRTSEDCILAMCP
jgi:hypothetical protein